MSRWQIGDVTITKIVELEAVGGSRFILPDATYDECKKIEWLYPNFMTEDGKLIMSIHALIVETPDLRMIVDTCLGNDKKRDIPAWNQMQTSFLSDIAEAGYPRETFDLVMCTHLHVDHVGWNTMLVDGEWVPTFENARYLMARDEYEHWANSPQGRREEDYFGDSVKPVFDAGKVDLVDSDHRICDEIWLEPTPGHTPGHVSVRIASKGQQALITGDFTHHPCQMARPHWCSSADFDQQAAEATRRKMLDKLADEPTLVIGTHFAGVTAGRVVRDGDAWRLDV